MAPGGGGCDNKAYDPEETSEGSSIASCSHSPHLNGKKVKKILKVSNVFIFIFFHTSLLIKSVENYYFPF